MSIAKTKEQLVKILADNDNRVIALSGRWGTGKTYLWDEVKNYSDDPKVKDALYVSLFGVRSIDQIKSKLVESTFSSSEAVKDTLGGGLKVIESVSSLLPGASKTIPGLKDLGLQVASKKCLSEKVIVIDDIERKHHELGIDEILGFIDEFSKQHKSRFILILNDNELESEETQSKLWKTFREKLIDHEVKLSTTPEEAFKIAIRDLPSEYSEAIHKASVACELTNIRIVSRVIKATHQILGPHEIDKDVQGRVIPSIVLFSAIHYHGIEGGPDFNFVLNVGNPTWDDLDSDNDGNSDSSGDKAVKAWRNLVLNLGIFRCDEFELYLVEYLESGLTEPEKVNEILTRYKNESDAVCTQLAVDYFITRTIWEHKTPESKFVKDAKQFVDDAPFMSPITATALYNSLTDLQGGQQVADRIIDQCVASLRQNLPETKPENPFGSPIHPLIAKVFDEEEATAQANTSVVDACIHISSHGGWSSRQEIALRNATVEDFEDAIRHTDDLGQYRVFMGEMIKYSGHNYSNYFGSAPERFIQACRNTIEDPGSARLAKLIKRLFKNAQLQNRLYPESLDH